jgi:hypothetical protein
VLAGIPADGDGEDDGSFTECKGASVQIAQSFEGQEPQVVQGFGAQVSPAYGYQPLSLALFHPARTHVPEFPELSYVDQDVVEIKPREDVLYAHLKLDRHGPDPLGPVDSMQLAVSIAVSPDRRHQYAAETETNSVSIHRFTPSGLLQFIDRRSHGEKRLRFLPARNAVADQPTPSVARGANTGGCIFPNASDPNLALSLQNVSIGHMGVRNVNGSWLNCSTVASQDICVGPCRTLSAASPDILLRCALECAASFPTTFVCGLEAFKSLETNDTFVAVAAGCESLSDLSSNYLPTTACAPEDLTPECGRECCMAIHESTVGLWNMTEGAILQAHRRINTFSGAHHINCSQSSCSYHRPRRLGSICSEQHDSW